MLNLLGKVVSAIAMGCTIGVLLSGLGWITFVCSFRFFQWLSDGEAAVSYPTRCSAHMRNDHTTKSGLLSASDQSDAVVGYHCPGCAVSMDTDGQATHQVLPAKDAYMLLYWSGWADAKGFKDLASDLLALSNSARSELNYRKEK